MQQFKIIEEKYRKFRKKRTTLLIPLLSVTITIIILANAVGPQKVDFNTMTIVISVLLIYVGFSYYRGLKKQKRLLMSYTVTFSDSEIVREQLNTPPLTINFMEIKEIFKSKRGDFTIRGLSRRDIICIPYLIDNPTELEQRLAAFGPIAVNPKDPHYKLYRIVLSIVALGSIAGLYMLTNKIIVGICGTLVSGLLAWTFYERQTSKNVPKNVRLRSWMYLLFIAVIIFTVYTKLTASPFAH